MDYTVIEKFLGRQLAPEETELIERKINHLREHIYRINEMEMPSEDKRFFLVILSSLENFLKINTFRRVVPEETRWNWVLKTLDLLLKDIAQELNDKLLAYAQIISTLPIEKGK